MVFSTLLYMSNSDSELTYLGWSEDVETLCKDIENNASKLAVIHKNNYLILSEQQKYFKIPIIILSSCNSIFAVGLNSYLQQNLVSSINCIISLICSIISSIELYIGLQKRIENELTSYRAYYLLGIKINNCLKLDREHRTESNGVQFLIEIENEYKTLFNDSLVNNREIEDKLLTINEKNSNPLYKYGISDKKLLVKKGGADELKDCTLEA
jgi:hypothetical protein